jgi:hypothetical protein
MWSHTVLWLCVGGALSSFLFDVALPSGGSPGSLAPPDGLVVALAGVFFSPIATFFVPTGFVAAAAACVLAVVSALMRIHWRALNRWTGAVRLQWEEMAFPAIGRLYAWYRRRWDPVLAARG